MMSQSFVAASNDVYTKSQMVTLKWWKQNVTNYDKQIYMTCSLYVGMYVDDDSITHVDTSLLGSNVISHE